MSAASYFWVKKSGMKYVSGRICDASIPLEVIISIISDLFLSLNFLNCTSTVSLVVKLCPRETNQIVSSFKS